MYNDERSQRRLYIVNHHEDTGVITRGVAIPHGRFHFFPQVEVAKVMVAAPSTWMVQLFPWFVGVGSVAFLALLFMVTPLTSIGASLVASLMQARSLPPQIVVEHPYTKEQFQLTYGVQLLFGEPFFFAGLREEFITAEQTFVEVNMRESIVRYFKQGVLAFSAPIVATGGRGSWGEVASGLYRVEQKSAQHFSQLGQVFLPWRVSFQGAVSIHGTPFYNEQTPVSEDYIGGSVWLTDDDAKALHALVAVGTPVIVHQEVLTPTPFVYEPKVPDIPAPHYLIADIGSNTVLASSNLDVTVPIASLTKLMTALVAVENLDLDRRAWISEPTFVQSLIPRLQDRTSVSLYSLLQLILIESSNEASEVLAAQLGRETFIELMNQRATTLGLASTTFADPSGLSANNQSTLRDILRLTQHIYRHRSFILELSANQNLPTTHARNEFGALVNFNPIEGDSTFIGGKIGETLAAGQTSVTLHRLSIKGEERILAIIVLGSDARSRDVRLLLEYVKERFAD